MISSKINLKQLEALIWVADLGSFRKAAKHLNTTQPNISARISSLEATFGQSLMRRDAGTLSMTHKGAEILAQARVILRDTERLAEIAERPDMIEDRLRLGVTELVAGTWLRRFIRNIKEVYPNLAVELTIDLSKNLDKELTANNLDLAIQTSPFSSNATGIIELGTYEFVWITSKDIAEKLGSKPKDEEFLQHPILTHARHTQAYVEILERYEKPGPYRPRFVPSSSLSVSIHMAQDGMGIAIVPRAMVERQLAEGSLHEVGIGWKPKPLRFAARFQSDKSPAFVSHVAKIALETSKAFRSSQANAKKN